MRIEKVNWLRLQKLFEEGQIIMCPICGKFDINPLQHKESSNCDPLFQHYRSINQDENYK